jgi:hypothetical protein
MTVVGGSLLVADPWEIPSAVVATGAVILGIYRFVVLPQLRRDLFVPIRETHTQVTRNHHTDPDKPTILDRLDDVESVVKELRGDVAEAMRSQAEHAAWADAEDTRVWRAIGKKADKQPPRRGGAS